MARWNLTCLIFYYSNLLFTFLSVDVENLTPFSSLYTLGCASGCTWLLQGVKISISTDRNVNNLYSLVEHVRLIMIYIMANEKDRLKLSLRQSQHRHSLSLSFIVRPNKDNCFSLIQYLTGTGCLSP